MEAGSKTEVGFCWFEILSGSWLWLKGSYGDQRSLYNCLKLLQRSKQMKL